MQQPPPFPYLKNLDIYDLQMQNNAVFTLLKVITFLAHWRNAEEPMQS